MAEHISITRNYAASTPWAESHTDRLTASFGP